MRGRRLVLDLLSNFVFEKSSRCKIWWLDFSLMLESKEGWVRADHCSFSLVLLVIMINVSKAIRF